MLVLDLGEKFYDFFDLNLKAQSGIWNKNWNFKDEIWKWSGIVLSNDGKIIFISIYF